MLVGAAAALGPEGAELRDDLLAELVAPVGERECDVGVQALELLGVSSAADTKLEHVAVVGSYRAARERPADSTLPVRRALEARAEVGIVGYGAAPATDATGRLDAGNRRNEARTRQIIGGRKGPPGVVVGCLLRYGRTAKGAAHDDAPEGAWGSAQLPLERRSIIHRPRS